MDAIGIIPARYGATRFEGKVLADLMGKPVIQHVWENARRASTLNDLIVATDDEKVKEEVERFGGKVVLTSKEHKTGTDRLREVVNPIDTKVVVNIQADEPLLHPSMIDDIVRPLLEDKGISMTTLKKKITDPEDLRNPNVVKVVTDKNGYAMYFSRSPIPFPRFHDGVVFYKHIGLYGFKKEFLFTFTTLPVSALENIEGLEQLRVLENGYKIKVAETQFDTIGIDTPEDLDRAKEVLISRSK
ncbi:MAG: 3-deoxy-manno-octulosonate cytidylyltransferase [Candidatus Omnitrophica bacterium]|nr:3-deoxy-manno-octulosonate cytidylyltransferase [Candidatus Omnitrophota bacterium]MDD5310820.1 3-deoxy-manno-octulosonate cytidylyltransferase [Candidatus Omnitrophota bacterium]MDD5546795.1 3-deoxy-manno-octulosonate cytidylyltransferase [Candidatus Omnitrophota bacterium]